MRTLRFIVPYSFLILFCMACDSKKNVNAAFGSGIPSPSGKSHAPSDVSIRVVFSDGEIASMAHLFVITEGHIGGYSRESWDQSEKDGVCIIKGVIDISRLEIYPYDYEYGPQNDPSLAAWSEDKIIGLYRNNVMPLKYVRTHEGVHVMELPPATKSVRIKSDQLSSNYSLDITWHYFGHDEPADWPGGTYIEGDGAIFTYRIPLPAEEEMLHILLNESLRDVRERIRFARSISIPAEAGCIIDVDVAKAEAEWGRKQM